MSPTDPAMVEAQMKMLEMARSTGNIPMTPAMMAAVISSGMPSAAYPPGASGMLPDPGGATGQRMQR